MNVHPTKVQWKDQQARWGTCTKSGTIYLNWKLIMAPISIIDYVLGVTISKKENCTFRHNLDTNNRFPVR
jgi:hypothetical protein